MTGKRAVPDERIARSAARDIAPKRDTGTTEQEEERRDVISDPGVEGGVDAPNEGVEEEDSAGS